MRVCPSFPDVRVGVAQDTLEKKKKTKAVGCVGVKFSLVVAFFPIGRFFKIFNTIMALFRGVTASAETGLVGHNAIIWIYSLERK